MSADAATLLARHEHLSTNTGTAAGVLRLCDDPDAGAADLARAIGVDPVFAARVLRVANSSYYGLSGRVSTLPFAISVIGFQTVRSLAVVAAAGLDDPSGAPAGFWPAAAVSATAAEVIAPLLSANPGDAFSLGLLHTLGAALLHQHEPHDLLCLPEPDDAAALVETEREIYGISHDLLAARVLATWHFPEHVCELIARHHVPVLPDATALERTLHCARLVADGMLRGELNPSAEAQVAWLTEGRVVPDELPALVDRVSERSASLLDGLRPRA